MILLPILALLVFFALSIFYIFWRIAKQDRHLDALQKIMQERKEREEEQSRLAKR
jgi:hypothetical protein